MIRSRKEKARADFRTYRQLGRSLAKPLPLAGYPIASIAKPSYDPRVTRWLQKWRTAHGLRIVWRDETNAGKSILSILRRNGLMAFLIDENTRTAGDYLPFFGRPAFTPTTPGSDRAAHGSPSDFLLASSPPETAQTEFQPRPVHADRRFKNRHSGIDVPAQRPTGIRHSDGA